MAIRNNFKKNELNQIKILLQNLDIIQFIEGLNLSILIKKVKILFLLCLLPTIFLSFNDRLDSLKLELEKSEGIEKAKLQSEVGSEYFDDENFPKTISYYKAALTYYESKGMKNDMISSYVYIANSYLNISIFDLALENYKNALTLSEKIKDEALIGEIYNHTGTGYLTIGENEKALNDYFLKALPIFEKLNDKKELAKCYNNIGITYGNLKKIDSSLVYFEKSLNINQELGDSLVIASVMSNVGYSYLQEGKVNKAIGYFNESLRISRLIGDKSAMSNALLNMAELYSEKNDYDKTISYALAALVLAENIDSKEIIQDAYILLADAYSEKGQAAVSLDYYKEYVSIHDSVYNNNMGQRLANVMALLGNEKKVQKIKELNVEKQLQEDKLEEKNKWLFVTIFILMIIILISIYIIRQNKKLTNANRDLVRKNLEVVHMGKSQKKGVINSKNDLKQLENDKKSAQLKYAGSAMNLEQKEKILKDLLIAFEEKKVFVNQDMTMVKLAELIGTNSSYISQVINEHFDKNFNNYINEYRIKEAILLLSEGENRFLSIEGISQTVGFKSKTAFNNAFKKYTGVTPTFFEKSSKDFKIN